MNRSVLVAYKGHLCVKKIASLNPRKPVRLQNFTRSNNVVSCIFAVGYLTPFSYYYKYSLERKLELLEAKLHGYFINLIMGSKCVVTKGYELFCVGKRM